MPWKQLAHEALKRCFGPAGAAQAQILPKCHRRCCQAASTVARIACGKTLLFAHRQTACHLCRHQAACAETGHSEVSLNSLIGVLNAAAGTGTAWLTRTARAAHTACVEVKQLAL